MIHFDPVSEPADFDKKARKRGAAWLKSHPKAKRPYDYWTPFKPALADGFGNLCGYSAMVEPVGTVDHFVSVKTDKSLAYEWDNYRYSAEWMNKSKQNADGAVHDPFEVQEGWFELLLPSLQLRLTDSVPPGQLDKARFTLKRLHLEHDERIIRQRRSWYRMYQQGKLSLGGLHEVAPLIARAVEKQQREVED